MIVLVGLLWMQMFDDIPHELPIQPVLVLSWQIEFSLFLCVQIKQFVYAEVLDRRESPLSHLLMVEHDLLALNNQLHEPQSAVAECWQMHAELVIVISIQTLTLSFMYR